jgi:two-component system chemotaxis response regulator CheB
MRILIAEDEDATALILTRVLERRGHVVVRAVDGQSAFELVRDAGAFDAIVTDWMMPRMDGIEFIRKARKELQDLPPIVVVTALASDQARNLVLEAGADDYLAKPVQPSELVQCLDSCVARHSQSPIELAGASDQLQAGNSVVGIPLVALVAGAGGPVALQRIFRTMDRAHESAFVVVQHGPNWMLETFAHKLQSQCSLKVNIAARGVLLEPGQVYIAPGDQHTVVAGNGRELGFVEAGHLNFLRPSGDILLRSLLPRATCSAAVVLTGMGCDGALGLSLLARAGAFAVVQDPLTAEVGSMPRIALSQTAAANVIELPDIATELDAWVGKVRAALHSAASANDVSIGGKHG